MKKSFFIIIALIAVSTFTFAGNDREAGASAARTAIQGKVVDFNTSEELAGVTVKIDGTDVKAYTDIEGNFRIEGIEPGNYKLSVSYISYEEKVIENVQTSVSPSAEIEIKLAQKN
jgi:hypothetical protein